MAEEMNLDQMIEIGVQTGKSSILSQLAQNLRRRREAAAASGADYEALAQGSTPCATGRLDQSVYSCMQRATVTCDRIYVKQYLSPRPIPLIGKAVQRMRGMLHEMVIYYVNRLAGKQAPFNSAVIQVLTGLIKAMEQDAARRDDELSALREHVRTLEVQLAELRTALGASAPRDQS